MRIVFMGTPDFAVPSLEALLGAGHELALVVTQPDRPRGRGRPQPQPPPVKRRAQAHGLPVFQPARVRRPDAIETIRATAPELIVVVAYGQILPPELLAVPVRGCLNVHASLLPRYRGAAPIHWAIIHGEAETGVTTMWMDAGLDTGDMILRRAVPIGPDETVGELHDRLAALGGECLVDTLRAIERGDAPRTPQPAEGATYAPPIRPEHERIDWTRPSRAIHNQVRGMNPWPGAHGLTARGRLKVWRTAVAAEDGAVAAPGAVVAVDPARGLEVAAGRGSLWLLEVQPENGRRMSGADYANGHGIRPGQPLMLY